MGAVCTAQSEVQCKAAAAAHAARRDTLWCSSKALLRFYELLSILFQQLNLSLQFIVL